MKKKLIFLLLTLAFLLCQPVPGVWGTGSEEPKGLDFTDDPVLASGLDRIFRGSLRLYRDICCTQEASAPLGSREVPPGETYYVKSPNGTVYSGTSCYIYANAVYATLFGDVPCHGEDVGWLNSQKVAGGLSRASYDAFRDAGVGFGALLRTTKNPDGSYNGSFGHSVIILKYDREAVTYLEGNGDGKGLIRVATRGWDSFNSILLSGRGYVISFIVQPVQERAETREPELVGYFKMAREYSGQFLDVPEAAWYFQGVSRAFETGLLNGVSSDRFAPGDYVTASEAVTLAARFLSLYYGDGHDFTGPGPWYAPYYAYLEMWGIGAGSLDPNEPVTRGELARLMALSLPDAAGGGSGEAAFPDVPPSEPYAQAVGELFANGIIQGDGGLFRPDDPLTRAQMAQIAARMADRSLRVR